MWYVHFQAKQNSHADCGITGPATPGLTVPLTAPLLTVSKNWSGTAALVGYMFSDQTLRLAVGNKHLVITWRQSPWIHRHIIALSFSRSNTVILKFRFAASGRKFLSCFSHTFIADH